MSPELNSAVWATCFLCVVLGILAAPVWCDYLAGAIVAGVFFAAALGLFLFWVWYPVFV